MVARSYDESRPEPEHDHTTAQPCPACVTKREAQQNDLERWDVLRERHAKIEVAQDLHTVCTPIAVIAQEVGESESVVRYIVQRGTFPQTELFEGEVAL